MSVPDAPSDLLSDSQRRLVALAVVLLALAVTVAVLVGTLAGLGWLLGYFSGVLWPLAVAGILALMLRPAVDWLETRLRFGRVPAVLMLYGVVEARRTELAANVHEARVEYRSGRVRRGTRANLLKEVTA